ncbi:MAG: flagellar filament capping protein FliD [FCB group bacterium]|nr:flagellar filament capping protein FliD [FCB group bacterium]
MAIDITSAFSNTSSIDYLVEQFMRVERKPRDNLQLQRNSLDDKSSIFTSLDSKLTALQSQAERFTDSITDYFAVKKATSSNTDNLTVSASSTADLGNHSITVTQLASSDTRVSQQYTDSSSSFTGFTADQTFSIGIAHPTDADANNRVSVSITVTASTFSQTDDSVLSDIADAINSAMASAVTADTIESDEVVHASVVNEESGKSRLVLRSENSGYTYRMDFTDSADSLLSTLQVSSASQSSGTSGGYITAVGTSASNSSLNANFVMDGLSFYRDSNNLTDALSGVTIKLLSTFASAETITISADTETVKSDIQTFMDNYNEVIDYLREKTMTNSDTYERGPLANDLTYKNIINTLRGYIVDSVSTVGNSDYSKLFNIGIEADDYGKLSWEDATKLTTAIEANSTFVSDIFNTSDGVATKIIDYLDNFTKVDGTIDQSKSNLDSQGTYLDDRLAVWDTLLIKKENTLRDEFSKLQEVMIKLNNQQNLLTQVFS